MQNDSFDDFVLFGGTALALQIGHRKRLLDMVANPDKRYN